MDIANSITRSEGVTRWERELVGVFVLYLEIGKKHFIKLFLWYALLFNKI